MFKLFIVFLLVLAINSAYGQAINSFQKKAAIHQGDTLLYQIQYPLNYKQTNKYPLVIMLHGSGERGNDNEAQLKWGGDLFADTLNRKKFPAIVIFPQCPAGDTWARLSSRSDADSSRRFTFLSTEPIGKSLGMVVQLIDSLAANALINTKKIYIGGLSMGGMGTYELLWRRPAMFAAAFPICGAGDTTKVTLYARQFPVWIFQGEKDPAVAVTYARAMVAALKAAGASVKYNEYPGVGHDSWKNAFADPELLPWLFAQHR